MCPVSQVDKLSKELGASQQTLEFVTKALQEYETHCKPPIEGIAFSSGESVDSESIHVLDHLLRRVGSAQAALPDTHDISVPNNAKLFAQLQDVDAATKARPPCLHCNLVFAHEQLLAD